MSVLSAQALNPQDCLIFFASDTLSFEHLDWLETRERLFQKGSFALTEEGSIKAMLGLSLDLPELAWLSFFRSLWNGSHAQYFSEIYAHTQSCLKASNIKSVYCLGLKGWMNSILQNEGFDVCDWIISLVRTGGITPQPCLPRGLSIRQAKKADLAEVLAVDWASFSSQWRMSAEGLSHAFQKAGAFSLALKQEKLVGYAFSGTHEQTAHLDRLAILPDFQGFGFAKALLANQTENLLQRGFTQFTVNTQQSNLPSQKLYKSLGYQILENRVPVFMHTIMPS